MASEHDPDPDLLWLALRYVSGELGRDEAEAFERRLDQDQGAREAVAEAVELAGAVAALAPTTPTGFVLPINRRPVRTLVGALALAAAACLAWLVVTLRGPAPARPAPEKGTVAVKLRPSETVTLAWSTLRQECEEATQKDEANGLVAWKDGLPESELPTSAETEEASDHGLPLWLLDAASLAGRPDADDVAAQAKEL